MYMDGEYCYGWKAIDSESFPWVGDHELWHECIPLHIACYFGIEGLTLVLLGSLQIDTVRTVYSAWKQLPLGCATVHWAFLGSSIEVARLFSERMDVDVNLKDMGGCAVLFHAGGFSQDKRPIEIREEMVQLLLLRDDLDVNIRNPAGDTVFFQLAFKHPGLKVLRAFLARHDFDATKHYVDGSDYTLLTGTVLYHGLYFHSWSPKLLELVSILLERADIDSNEADEKGDTALSEVLRAPKNTKGYEEMLKLLLNDKRIDTTKPDKNNQTPMDIAIAQGCPEIIQMLTEQIERDRVELQLTIPQ
jgi:hypothetical protein